MTSPCDGPHSGPYQKLAGQLQQATYRWVVAATSIAATTSLLQIVSQGMNQFQASPLFSPALSCVYPQLVKRVGALLCLAILAC